MNTVDIIIPVYGGYSETVACLSSVLSTKNRTCHEIIVIYDAGPESRLLDYLEGLAAEQRITLLVNPANVGFVKTVNRGLALHRDRDVVLLNSDTQVANNWLDRIVACAQSEARIATVTPFSNNAEICSFPAMCQSAELPADWDVERLDRIFAQHVTPAAVDIPTGVGFCMYIARQALEEVGYLNEALFGRGYGEENDLCRRLAACNWRNVLCTNVFVYHRGAVSFGAEKARLIVSAMQTLDRLYPDYHQLVQEFIGRDAPEKYRLQAQLAMLAAERPRVLCITHNLDGGTTKHVRELAQHMAGRAYFFVLRMRAADDLELRGVTEWGEICLYFRYPQQTELFEKLLSLLGVSKVHVHHIKGIERFVEQVLKSLNLPYDITLHDYYFINGNPALTDKSGRFCSDLASRDRVCEENSPVPLNYTADQWRVFTGNILRGAKRIIAPSRYVAELFAEYFPEIRYSVAYHPDWEVDAPYPPVKAVSLASGEKLRVLALGALGLEKGADILEQTALLAVKNKYPIEFHLLGYAYRELGRSVIVHGAYDDSELDAKIAELKPHVIWFPCQWPETYSYTLSACLRGGYPVLAPDLGAFIERLAGRPLSWLQSFPTTPELWVQKIEQIRSDVFTAGAAREFVWGDQVSPQESEFNYSDQYLDQELAGGVSYLPPTEWLDVLGQLQSRPLDSSRSRRERMLRILLRLRQAPIVRVISRFIPFSLQRRVKRSLSSRALHHIARDLLMVVVLQRVVLQLLSNAYAWM